MHLLLFLEFVSSLLLLKIHDQITQTITKTKEDQYRNRLQENLDILTEIYTTIPTLQNPPITYIFDIETQNNNTLQDTINIYENLLHYIELPTLQNHIQNNKRNPNKPIPPPPTTNKKKTTPPPTTIV